MTTYPGSLPPPRRLYKAALIDLVAHLRAPLFHVTAMLPPGSSQPGLEGALSGWAARVDRFYLGRNWQRSDGRMDGLAFFERYPDHHAHLVVCPPEGAEGSHFLANAGYWFAPDPHRALGETRPRPVTRRGRMMIQQIGDSVRDRARVTGYAAKEIEFRSDALAGWKFVRDLSRR